MVPVAIGNGRAALIARIQDKKGVWLAFKQASDKLFAGVPRQSLNNTLARQSQLRVRLATDQEKDFLKSCQAIKSRGKGVKLHHIEELILAARRLGLSPVLQSSLASLRDDRDDGQEASGFQTCTPDERMEDAGAAHGESCHVSCLHYLCVTLVCSPSITQGDPAILH